MSLKEVAEEKLRVIMGAAGAGPGGMVVDMSMSIASKGVGIMAGGGAVVVGSKGVGKAY